MASSSSLSMSLILSSSLVLLVVLLPLLSLAQILPYNSAPLIWHTFDVPPPGNPLLLNYSWVNGSQPHTGQAWFNGQNNYVDLLTTRDDYGRTFPRVLPRTLTLEYWVMWRSLQRWSRIFECGQGISSDNMNVANLDTTATLAVGVDNGALSTRTSAPLAIKQTSWQHIVITLAQQTLSNNLTGTMTIYVDGSIVTYRNDSYLLKPIDRIHCWIGRSEFNPPAGTDQWFNGIIDDFFYYDYPLSAEAVLAHFILPRPPVYELTFSTDPRLIGTRLPSYNYSWSDRDLNDGSNITKYHNGHLVLRQDSFIDMARTSGPASIGATPLPTIGGQNSGANGTLPRGWTIEVLVKALTVEPWAKIYDIGSGAPMDNILLGYEEFSNRLRFEWFIAGVVQPTLIVLGTTTANTWYHITVVMQQGATVASNQVISYVNGIRTNSTMGVTLPRSILRTEAYVGKSHWNDEYFDCYLDAFRLYDYALSQQEATDLYKANIEQVQIDIDRSVNPVYHSAPQAAFTFHTTRPGNLSSYGGSSYAQVQFDDGHYGAAQFNGATDFIDLTAFPDDPDPPLDAGKTGRLMPMKIGKSMSFEVWVKFTRLNSMSRIFDIGAQFGSNANTIVLANTFESTNLMFETYAGSNYGGVVVPGVIRPGQWQHIVATVQQISINDTDSARAGRFKVYVDGRLAGTNDGYLPYTFTHPSSFLGRSNHLTDKLFNGLIDSFYFYDYALQYEQVAAHHILPRPPVFELAFTYDPRPWLGGALGSYQYSWQEFDPLDQGLNATQYHNGYLVLTGDNWVNLTATSGPNTVGTVVPTTLFSPITGSGPIVQPPNALNSGWSFELLVKLQTLENNTNIFDFGNGPGLHNVFLGYSGLQAQLVFQIIRPTATESSFMPVITGTQLNRWYHIVIVLRVTNALAQRCSINVYVDGEGPVILAQKWCPSPVARTRNFLGRSNAPGVVGFFDMKLDTFRVYDYALTTAKVVELFALTVATLPGVQQPVYDTKPVAQYTFDSRPDYSDGVTAFDWRANDTSDASHAGVAHFNGVDHFVNLMTFLDDTGTPFPAVWGNTSVSFEAWVKFERFGWYSRVFDFGNGAEGDNVMASNFESTNRVAVHVYTREGANVNSTVINLPATFALNQWQHFVVSIEDQSRTHPALVTRGRNGPDAALYSMYLNGRLIGTSRGYIPRAVERTQSFLAKSHWVRDDLFQGSIDSFYFYNYALSGEQVGVHIIVPRPPVFDLSFSSDPRLLLGGVTGTYDYSWQDFDPTDAYSNGTRYHTGHLVLDSARRNFVDLSSATGQASLGVVLPRIGGRVSSVGGTEPGWSIEIIAKISTTASWGKLIDWSNGGGHDNIAIGYASNGNTLQIQVFNDLLVSPDNTAWMTLVETVTLGRWYHIVIVMKPAGTTGWGATWEVHVDGEVARTETGKVLPQNVQRRMAWLGKSTWVNDSNPYFSAKIDAIRVFDYALTPTMSKSLYSLAADPNYIPVQEPSTGIPAVRRSSSSSSSGGGGTPPTTRTSSSSGPGGICEYGGVWPDRCECRCYTGYYPNCIPCPGEEPAGPPSTPAVSTGGIVAIIGSIFLVVVVGIVVAVWYKNKSGRVTYALDGGFSGDGGDTGDGWFNPAAARKAKVGGGGLLGQDVQEDSASTYDWQAYRSNNNSAREASQGHWSNN